MMTEYKQIRNMHHQEYLLKEKKVNYKTPWRKWLTAKRIVKTSMDLLGDNEKQLKEALQLSAEALSQKVATEDNPPLKKVALESMDGEPAWVVSYNHDGRWGIVNVADGCVNCIENGEIDQEYWFEGNYIFRYKKTIVDYSSELERFGIIDNGDSQ